jgi:hypothetical protein
MEKLVTFGAPVLFFTFFSREGYLSTVPVVACKRPSLEDVFR